MAVRAKFKVASVERFEFGGEKVNLFPVSSDSDQESENFKFWTATPSGKLEMQINNPDAQGMFEPGQEYYIDFTSAELVASHG